MDAAVRRSLDMTDKDQLLKRLAQMKTEYAVKRRKLKQSLRAKRAKAYVHRKLREQAELIKEDLKNKYNSNDECQNSTGSLSFQKPSNCRLKTSALSLSANRSDQQRCRDCDNAVLEDNTRSNPISKTFSKFYLADQCSTSVDLHWRNRIDANPSGAGGEVERKSNNNDSNEDGICRKHFCLESSYFGSLDKNLKSAVLTELNSENKEVCSWSQNCLHENKATSGERSEPVAEEKDSKFMESQQCRCLPSAKTNSADNALPQPISGMPLNGVICRPAKTELVSSETDLQLNKQLCTDRICDENSASCRFQDSEEKRFSNPCCRYRRRGKSTSMNSGPQRRSDRIFHMRSSQSGHLSSSSLMPHLPRCKEGLSSLYITSKRDEKNLMMMSVFQYLIEEEKRKSVVKDFQLPTGVFKPVKRKKGVKATDCKKERSVSISRRSRQAAWSKKDAVQNEESCTSHCLSLSDISLCSETLGLFPNCSQGLSQISASRDNDEVRDLSIEPLVTVGCLMEDTPLNANYSQENQDLPKAMFSEAEILLGKTLSSASLGSSLLENKSNSPVECQPLRIPTSTSGTVSNIDSTSAETKIDNKIHQIDCLDAETKTRQPDLSEVNGLMEIGNCVAESVPQELSQTSEEMYTPTLVSPEEASPKASVFPKFSTEDNQLNENPLGSVTLPGSQDADSCIKYHSSIKMPNEVVCSVLFSNYNLLGKSQDLVICLSLTRLSIWAWNTRGKLMWSLLHTWHLDCHQEAEAWLLEAKDTVVVAVLGCVAAMHELWIYSYTSQETDPSGSRISLSGVVQSKYAFCPLNERAFAVATSTANTISVYKCMLNGKYTAVQNKENLEPVIGELQSLVAINGINSDLLALTTSGDILIWNHDTRTLLARLLLDSISMSSVMVANAFFELGHILLPVINGQKNEDSCLLAIHPKTGSVTKLVSYSRSSFLKQHNWNRATTFANILLISSCHILGIWDIFSGLLMATIQSPGICCISGQQTENGTVLLTGHNQGCVHIYRSDETLLVT